MDKLLPARSKIQRVEHFKALHYRDIPQFIKLLQQREGVSARAVEFAILTVARSGEIRGALWSEIDFEEKLWIIPARRMKMDKEHRIPLCDKAMRLLNHLPRLDGCDFVFPAPRSNKALSDMSLTAVLKRMDYQGITMHGFRSTFRDWAGETTHYPREVIEHALAHKLKDKAEAAYQRGDMLQKRRLLMQEWADFCDPY
ncbi:tyrosine-type recombinase/integrase [Saezia sanguinis]|nr:site-specific integrase [Saezia sanguinis]